jgi:hypothetical protein
LGLKVPIKPKTDLPAVSHLGRAGPIRRRYTSTVPKKLQSLRKALMFELLNEPENIPTGLTTKTVKKLAFRIDLERWCFFLVKWAQGNPYPAPLPQGKPSPRYFKEV